MDFADRIQDLAARIPKQRDHVETEEATKNAFVMPFIGALGYNVFDPLEVRPEFDADVGVKKGEKVDYAILRDGKPIMLFECKWHGTSLDEISPTQLFRYFTATDARFAVLTNGIVYRFFTDLDAPNKLDGRHFFEIDLLDLRENELEELKKFSNSAYNEDEILTSASELKYTREIRRHLAEEMGNPSDDFVRLFAKRVSPGRHLSQLRREQFAEFTKRAFQQLINESINQRLDSAKIREETPKSPAPDEPIPSDTDDGNGAVTTDEEREAFYIVRAILCAAIPVERVAMRDHKSYCAILLDDNNRKPICRLRLSATRSQIGFFDREKNEDIVTITSLSELYQYGQRLLETLSYYT